MGEWWRWERPWWTRTRLEQCGKTCLAAGLVAATFAIELGLSTMSPTTTPTPATSSWSIQPRPWSPGRRYPPPRGHPTGGITNNPPYPRRAGLGRRHHRRPGRSARCRSPFRCASERHERARRAAGYRPHTRGDRRRTQPACARGGGPPALPASPRGDPQPQLLGASRRVERVRGLEQHGGDPAQFAGGLGALRHRELEWLPNHDDVSRAAWPHESSTATVIRPSSCLARRHPARNPK